MADSSILTDVKKVLGLDASYTAFDLDIIMHINTAFATLNQLGIGPADGFMIEDDSAMWDDFLDPDADNPSAIKLKLNNVKTYVSLRVRMIFDPPTTAFVLAAYQKQIEELEWRINVVREEVAWVDPNPPPVDVYCDPFDDGTQL